MSALVIWGMGGHGKVVLDVARSTARFFSVAFVDDDPSKWGSQFCFCEVLGNLDQVPRTSALCVLIAIGSNRVRARCYSKSRELGFEPTTLIHSAAILGPSASVEAGTVVMAGAIVNADSRVGENCIINTGAIVEHDCVIGNHVHISPRVALGGGVKVGSYAHVGIGAVVLPGIHIGDGAVVGAGAVVVHPVEPNTTVVGVPARPVPGKASVR